MLVPARLAAFPTSPSSSKRTRTGRARRRCAGMPKKRSIGESDTVAAGWLQALSAGRRCRQGPRSRDHAEFRRYRRRHGSVAGHWIDADFEPLDERNFLARHSDAIRPEDHAKRVDRLLWDGQIEAARRMLPLLSPDYRALAEARLALAARSSNADALVAKVPARLRSDPGLVFEQLRLAPEEGHDRCRGANSARPARRSRPAGGMVGRTAGRCPTGPRRR